MKKYIIYRHLAQFWQDAEIEPGDAITHSQPERMIAFDNIKSAMDYFKNGDACTPCKIYPGNGTAEVVEYTMFGISETKNYYGSGVIATRLWEG